ncbi:hypothetical protein PROFUN_06047 [Planoprotostelium fungivorum]|uniref:B30.2/SPRY domain-containing protein n=1 Tax=Planoprotostelium fungivorum TaxID=1890364 RepID=A0A2P6NPP7_9EUKA|nr:hypothetical protein PROFUN_06047 [Planoprotostelium fungivorum]
MDALTSAIEINLFDSLPTELLYYIVIQHIKEENDVRRLTCVCRRWRDVCINSYRSLCEAKWGTCLQLSEDIIDWSTALRYEVSHRPTSMQWLETGSSFGRKWYLHSEDGLSFHLEGILGGDRTIIADRPFDSRSFSYAFGLPLEATTVSSSTETLLALRPPNYYEVTITSNKKAETMRQRGTNCVAIGFAYKDFPREKVMPGWLQKSLAWHGDDGKIFLNGLSNSFGRQLIPGDTVGCGLNDKELLIYYTVNGKPSGVVNLDDGETFFNGEAEPFYPVVGLDTEYEIQVNFGNRPFLWNPTASDLRDEARRPPCYVSYRNAAPILFAIVFCLAVHADISEDFPQPPYNVVETFTSGEITSITCPADCGNPDSRHCLWNADIQNTCSATYAEKRSVEEKRQGRCQQLGACGPVCWSDGQGGYACGCVSCGKK